MTYTHYFQDQLTTLKQEGRYRFFVDLERNISEAPYALWHCPDGTTKKVNVWCSNDYLSMSHHPFVVEAMAKAVQEYGAGSGGTRNISGTAHPHVLLEKSAAHLHKKEAALLFSSGYTANETAIATLASFLPNCLVVSDEKNHASVIQGIRHSHAEKVIMQHNNMDHLESILKNTDSARPKIVIVTSVYSMDGDIAPLEKIARLSRQYNALSYVDEVHAVGMYGHNGGGIISTLGIEDQIDVIQGNFAKAYGVVGGYIAATASLIDFVRSHASGFIFTTSLPPAVAVAARASVEFLKTDQERRAQFWDRVHVFKKALAQTRLPFIKNESHIVPVVVGNAVVCKEISDQLLSEYGLYVQPINYPTVPRGQERLRLTITPAHTHEHIHEMVEALETVCERLKILAA